MKRRIVHIVFVPILALLLLFAATPKDFLHGLTGHQDTVHTHYDDDDATGIGNPHHHCDFLTLLAPPFEASHFILAFVPRTILEHEPESAPVLRGKGRIAGSPRMRGPPAA